MDETCSMYHPMEHERRKLMMENQEYIESMLDYAIEQLVEISEENDILLIDNSHVCVSYEQIFDCLKHWSQKRMANAK